MKKYEVMYILSCSEDDEVNAISSSIKQMLEMNDSQIVKEDLWGKKRLCYEELGLADGFYVLLTFFAKPNVIRKLDQKLRTTDEVLRHMIISCGD